MDICEQSEPQMCLKAIKDDFVEQALTVATVLNTGEHASHPNVVGLQLRDHVLPQASCAEAHPIAEVTNPTAIVLAHIEVVIVA